MLITSRCRLQKPGLSTCMYLRRQYEPVFWDLIAAPPLSCECVGHAILVNWQKCGPHRALL